MHWRTSSSPIARIVRHQRRYASAQLSVSPAWRYFSSRMTAMSFSRILCWHQSQCPSFSMKPPAVTMPPIGDTWDECMKSFVTNGICDVDATSVFQETGTMVGAPCDNLFVRRVRRNDEVTQGTVIVHRGFLLLEINPCSYIHI